MHVQRACRRLVCRTRPVQALPHASADPSCAYHFRRMDSVMRSLTSSSTSMVNIGCIDHDTVTFRLVCNQKAVYTVEISAITSMTSPSAVITAMASSPPAACASPPQDKGQLVSISWLCYVGTDYCILTKRITPPNSYSMLLNPPAADAPDIVLTAVPTGG